MISRSIKWLGLVAVAGLMFACQKLDRPELSSNYPKDPAGSGGDLKLYMAFDGTEVDSVRAMFGTPKNVTYVNGINGKAYKGGDNTYIAYPSPSLAASLTSFSVSLWMNTAKHPDGAQVVFMIPQTGGFWGNMFMLIESNSSATDNSMLVKFHFGPDGGPNDQWVVYDGANRLPNMYNAWKHVVYTYDAGTSKFEVYVDGSKVNMPAGVTDRKAGANPLGSNFSFKNVSKFIIGGYQQHLGSPWNAPETWMKTYTGLLDQFRIYGKALSAAEVKTLFDNKQ